MKKTIFIAVIILLSVIISGNLDYRKSQMTDISADIYYIDSSMLKLIPIKTDMGVTTVDNACKKVADKLVNTDYKSVLNVFPDVKNGLKVTVIKNTAYVDLSDEFVKKIPKNRIHAQLMVYSIVNSLTSIHGIDTVEFLINGEKKNINIAGIDMREAFIPDYYM